MNIRITINHLGEETIMPLFNVLMTTSNYVEVWADNSMDAEMEAWWMYKNGDIRPEYPEFVCEKCDIVEEA